MPGGAQTRTSKRRGGCSRAAGCPARRRSIATALAPAADRAPSAASGSSQATYQGSSELAADQHRQRRPAGGRRSSRSGRATPGAAASAETTDERRRRARSPTTWPTVGEPQPDGDEAGDAVPVALALAPLDGREQVQWPRSRTRRSAERQRAAPARPPRRAADRGGAPGRASRPSAARANGSTRPAVSLIADRQHVRPPPSRSR